MDEYNFYHVALAFDSHQEYAAVLINNLKIKTDKKLKFHLFIPNSLNFLVLQDFLINNKLDYKIYYIDQDKFKNFIINKNKYPHISDATFYRLGIPEMIDEEIEWYLYLDLDLYINCDVAEIFGFIDNDFELIAVTNNVGMTGGVELVNRKKMIKKLPLEKAINLQREFNFPGDNELISFFMADKIKPLDEKYNFVIQSYILSKNRFSIKHSDFKEQKIIHFAGTTKPWRYSTNLPFTREWRVIYYNIFGKNPWTKVNFVERVKKIIYTIFPNPRIFLTMLKLFKK